MFILIISFVLVFVITINCLFDHWSSGGETHFEIVIVIFILIIGFVIVILIIGFVFVIVILTIGQQAVRTTLRLVFWKKKTKSCLTLEFPVTSESEDYRLESLEKWRLQG